jgi:glycerol-3-phosphate O-acyltransferase/dihydroxyacetone phosphate acyltransferase
MANDSTSKKVPTRGKKRGNKLQIPWLYDLVLWSMSVLVDLFFREVYPRGAWKVPRRGPVILVAAPHANQVEAFPFCRPQRLHV